MKIILFPVLITLASTAFSQNPGEPCCAVVGINTATNTVIARNNATGRLFTFKTDGTDIRSVKLKDAVTANANLTSVVAVNGAVRKYGAEPVNSPQINWSEPCCSIVQIDNLEPCCNMVSAKNKTTGAVITFKVPKPVLGTVKIGDGVFSDSLGSGYWPMAIIQSSYQGENGQLNSFGYPIESGNQSSQESSAGKWVISTANVKGVFGRLNTDFPSDVEWSVDIRKSADNKFITNRSGFSKHGPAQDVAPGIYNFRLNTILVENVPIERGKETRLKTGVLNIVSPGHWELYDETKTRFHTSGNKLKKIALPAGSYQLKLGGQFFPVVIRDKETVEY